MQKKIFSTPYIQLNHVQSHHDLVAAQQAGATAVGFLIGLDGPASSRLLPDEAEALIADTPDTLQSVMITSLKNAALIVDIAQRIGARHIQLNTALTVKAFKKIRQEMPGVNLRQVISLSDEKNLKVAQTASAHLDSITLKADRHDGLTRYPQFAEMIDCPIILHADVNGTDLRKAITAYKPSGLVLAGAVDSEESKTIIRAFKTEASHYLAHAAAQASRQGGPNKQKQGLFGLQFAYNGLIV